MLAREDQLKNLEQFYYETQELCPNVQWLDKRDLETGPFFQKDYLEAAVFEPESQDIDVNALHQGF